MEEGQQFKLGLPHKFARVLSRSSSDVFHHLKVCLSAK